MQQSRVDEGASAGERVFVNPSAPRTLAVLWGVLVFVLGGIAVAIVDAAVFGRPMSWTELAVASFSVVAAAVVTAFIQLSRLRATEIRIDGHSVRAIRPNGSEWMLARADIRSVELREKYSILITTHSGQTFLLPAIPDAPEVLALLRAP